MKRDEIKMSIDFFQKDGILDNVAVCGGIYICELSHSFNTAKRDNILIYIGQGNNMLARGTQHLNKIFKDPSYFGLTDDMLKDSRCKLIFSVHEAHAKYKRQTSETSLIKRKKPIIQIANDKGKADTVITNKEDRLNKVEEAYKSLIKKTKKNLPQTE